MTAHDEFLISGRSSCGAVHGDDGKPDCKEDDRRRGYRRWFRMIVGMMVKGRLQAARCEYKLILPLSFVAPKTSFTPMFFRVAACKTGKTSKAWSLNTIHHRKSRVFFQAVLKRVLPGRDGTELRIDRCLIDANWGSSTDVVYQFCRQSPHAGVVLPSHGRFVGAASRPFSEYKRRPGERVGLNWRVTNNLGKRMIRHVLFDTNFWKSFIQARLVVAQGDPGCLSLFEDLPESHRLFAEHLTAEYRIRTEGRGRTVDEWKIRPEQADNHWFDGVIGCAVAASIQGCVMFGTELRDNGDRPRRVRLSALRRSRGQASSS